MLSPDGYELIMAVDGQVRRSELLEELGNGALLVHLAPLMGAPDIAPMARNTSLMLQAAVYDIEPPKLNPVEK